MDEFIEVRNREVNLTGQHGAGNGKKNSDEQGPANGEINFSQIFFQKMVHGTKSAKVKRDRQTEKFWTISLYYISFTGTTGGGTFFSYLCGDFFPLAPLLILEGLS